MKIQLIVQPISHHLGPNDSLSKVAKWLEAEGIAASPVADHDGTLLGIVTAQDVVTASADTSDSEEPRTIADLVRPDGICTLDDDLLSLADQAKSQNHSHIVLVDNLGNSVGIADLSPYRARSHEIQHREEALDEALEETFPASDPVSPP